MYRQTDMIAGRIAQIEKMRAYLAYSTGRMQAEGIGDKNLQALSDTDAETFAAFRARFSEYQEHLGKLLKSIALEEGVQVVGMSDVLAFAETSWSSPNSATSIAGCATKPATGVRANWKKTKC